MSTIAPDRESEWEPGVSEEVAEGVPKLVGVIGEFAAPSALIAAAEKVRDAGYTRWDTFTPFPIHGMDKAMGIRYTFLPWVVLAGGMTGTTLAIVMQWYMNASKWAANIVPWPLSGYQYPISGKPYWSLPANIPIAFELTVLLAAFASFFGMLILNRLLQWYNPLFKVERFKKVTDDRFFLAIDARDPKFDAAALPDDLRELGALATDECWDNESRRIPGQFHTWLLIIFAVSLLPPVWVMRHRSTTWSTPRIHPVPDMDYQLKFKSQQRNVFFADQRAMRRQVAGTISRGEITPEIAGNYTQYYLGIKPGQAMAFVQDGVGASEGDGGDGSGGDSGVESQSAPVPESAADADDSDETSGDGDSEPAAEGEQGAGSGAPKNPPAGMVEDQNWVETIPIPVTKELMARGKERYGIYCAPCHGYGGYGDGIVNRRALSLGTAGRTWIRVPSLHEQRTRNRPDGYIFRAITEGVRKMPAYGDQISPHDRWAIVLYVRALQRSQGAEPR